MNITTQLQFILVKRWAETSWNNRYFGKILQDTFNQYKDEIIDTISTGSPMMKLLKTKGSIKST